MTRNFRPLPADQIISTPVGQTVSYEIPVAPTRIANLSAEQCEDRSGILSRQFLLSHHNPVSRPPVPFQCGEIACEICPHRVEVDVSDELQEVFILLADDGLVPILEEVPATIMSEVEGDRVPRQKPTHEGGKFAPGRTKQQVEMVRYQCPRKARRFSFHQ